MNIKPAWDDLRLVLAIASAGTLSGAARHLGVSHATVYRRLCGIEDRLGVKLFDRSRSGYSPTLAGEEVAAAATRMQTEALSLERRIAGRNLRPSETVRVTTLDSFLLGILSPIFAEFLAAHHEISLEIAVSNQLFSLSKREADVAIRPAAAAPEALVGCKVGTVACAIYGRRELVEAGGGSTILETATWVGPDDAMRHRLLETWMANHGYDAQCRYRVDSVLGMCAAVCDGHGIAVLPCYLGDPDGRLGRIGEAVPELAVDIWIVTHPDLRETARIRVLMDFVAEAFADRRGLLAGEPGT